MTSLLTKAVAIAAMMLGATVANAEGFSERPINLVAPFNAGGGTDLLLRAFAPHFAEALGGDAFVSNMAVGSGTVGAAALAGQKPDSYQMGYWSVTVSTIQPQVKGVPYGVDSWTPICSVAAFSGLGVIDDMKHLHFQGSGSALQAMAAGTIQFFGGTELLMTRSDFRPLMVFNSERLASMPDVPTAAEVGIASPLNELYLWGWSFCASGP